MQTVYYFCRIILKVKLMSGYPVLLFLDISGGELLVIMLVAFLVFGPEKMPEIARKVGKAMNQMKKASNDLTREFKKETSSLQDEISNVKSGINKEIESVSREYSSNKSRIYENLNDIDQKVEESPEISADHSRTDLGTNPTNELKQDKISPE